MENDAVFDLYKRARQFVESEYRNRFYRLINEALLPGFSGIFGETRLTVFAAPGAVSLTFYRGGERFSLVAHRELAPDSDRLSMPMMHMTARYDAMFAMLDEVTHHCAAAAHPLLKPDPAVTAGDFFDWGEMER